MKEEGKADNYKKVDNSDSLELNRVTERSTQAEPKEEKKKGCQFPTAYTILIILEALVFFLTYIVQKGQFEKIEYSSERNIFIIKTQNGATYEREAKQEVLDGLNIKIPIESFKKGYIKKPISIPGTYQAIEGDSSNLFMLFVYPIKGLIDSCNIAAFLFVLGGTLNILIEMEALSAGMTALSRVTKGKEFLLLILVFLLISISGSVIGLLEEILAFYPILMPVFLKSGMDGMVGLATLFLSSIIGNMFSTVNAFTVVLGSYSAGINFINGIAFRAVSFALGNIISILYIYLYYRKIKSDETKSIVYDIKQGIEDKFLKEEKEKIKKQSEENLSAIDITEETLLAKKEKEKEDEKNKFTCLQKIALLIFLCAFGVMIFGVMALDWWFEEMASVFIIFAIILMVLLNKGEQKALEIFIKGAGEFVGVSCIIGLARGINITLEEGKISDTILNSLTKAVSGLPTMLFGVLMLIIFMLLGILISSSTGLAILAMPIFSPLADEVKLSRKVIVNTYMFGQYFSGIVTPTGLVLIASQMSGISYKYFIKFIWPFLIIFFIFLVILIVIDVLIES